MGNDVREYTDRSSELLGERFKRLQFAFLKDNGKFVACTPISMASHPLRDLTEHKEMSDAVTKKYVDDLIADNVGEDNMNGGVAHSLRKTVIIKLRARLIWRSRSC